MKTYLNSQFLHNLLSRRILLVALLFITAFTPTSLKASDFYWVGGSGNWSDYGSHWATSSGGSIFHTAIPTINDDVYFDANSFSAAGQTVTLDNTFIYCQNMNWTGALFNPQIDGVSNTLNINGSLTLNPAMDWNVKRVDFSSAVPGNTITTAGISLDTLYFKGAGAYALTENITTKSIFIENGSFATANFSITTNKFIAGIVGSTVNVDLGTSSLFISDVFNAYYGTVNLSSASANLNFVNSVVPKMYFWATGQDFNNLYFQSNSEVIGSFHCQQLTTGGAFYINSYFNTLSCTDAIFGGGTILDCTFSANNIALTGTGVIFKIRQLTVNNTFTGNGICGQPIQFQPVDFLNSASLIIPSGAVTVDYFIITSIQASGGATFTATNSVDGGNNSGWAISSPAARTLYWVGGTGNWEDESHWALASGGPGGNCIPSLLDDVYFDANSFNQAGQVVSINTSPAKCKNMDWSNVAFNPAIGSGVGASITLYGSNTLSPNMQWNIYTMEFAGSGLTNTLFTAGLNVPSVVVNGTGALTLTDELNCSGVGVYQGTFNSGNYDIHAEVFFANGNNSSIFVNLGTSTLYLSDKYMAFSNQLTINSANANVVLQGPSGPTPIEFQSYDAQFNNFTCLSNSYVGKVTVNKFDAYANVNLTDLTALRAEFRTSFVAAKLTADSLIFSEDVNQFSFDTVQVNDAFITATNCSNTLSLNKYNPFNASATLIKTSGTVTLDYLFLSNINATGGATFIANNSWDLGNNTGWTINSAPARDLYWVGGTGVWSENANWSLSSGGPGGECQPAMQDNVIFDANSFAQTGDTVYINPAVGVFCNNMTFSSIPNGTQLYCGAGNINLNVYGSVTFPQELNLYGIMLNLLSTGSGNTVTTGGNNLDGINFAGTGSWTLQDPLNTFHFKGCNGTFYSNGFPINSSDFNIGGAGTLNFGTSEITALGFYVSNPLLNIVADSANITMTNSFLSFEPMGAHFNTVTFTTDANTTGSFSANYLYALGNFSNVNSQITAGYAEFKNNVTLSQSFVGDTIVFDNPGDLVLISQMTVNGTIISNGTSGFPVQLEGYNGSGTLQKSSGQICLENMLIRNVTATGGALFFAGSNSVDLGGNSGWSFTACVPPVSDVWPGDANYDLIADNNDVLNIGLAYGFTGPVRTGASLAWVAQPANDWSSQFANGANLKHADTDGSGVVDADDTTAVSLNYGLTHPFRLQNPASTLFPAPVLYITTNPDTANTSDTVEVSIFLGTTTTPVDSIYGIAFTVNFDTALVNTNYLNADFSACWMGTQQVDLLAYNKNLMNQGRVDVTLVRTDQNNTNGFGFLGKLGIVIVDNVGAKITLPVTLSNITAITASEYIVPVSFENDSVVIDTTGTVGLPDVFPDQNKVSVYPNPADQFLQVASGDLAIDSYVIFNQYGSPVANRTTSSKRFRVSTGDLSQGVYTIQFHTEAGMITKKFLVVRK